MGENWSYISPILAGRGCCVFALTYGLDPRLSLFGGVIPSGILNAPNVTNEVLQDVCPTTYRSTPRRRLTRSSRSSC
jgi:hypothetical protein